MIEKLEAGKTYRLIDEQGFIDEDTDNLGVINEYVSDNEVTIDDVIADIGYVNNMCIITTAEYKYFEEVVIRFTTGEDEETSILWPVSVAESTLKLNTTEDKTLGMKFDDDKLDWSLLPLEPIEEVIKVLMFGAKKYAPDNWKHVDNADTRYYNAAMRHITSGKKGEMYDPETGKFHTAHAICCLLFKLYKEIENEKHSS